MPIPLQCDCGKCLRARDQDAGKRARCPGCGTVLTIPTPDAIVTAPPAAKPGPEEIAEVLPANRPRPWSSKY
ncbi:MAG TPA: hypothetical protein VFA26_09040 [Gemmataceae bacterium]|nr:hypothetical protein [Gemmataceae bacterium]